MGQTCEKCLSTSQYCDDCSGSGKCKECKGRGILDLPDRQLLKTEFRKLPDGRKVPEMITTVIKGDTRFCSSCGGWGEQASSIAFRGNNAGGPVDYGNSTVGRSSPPRGKPGHGKCVRCSGTGKTTTPLIPMPLARKLKF